MTMCTTDSGSGQILASASYDDTIKLYIDDPSEDWYCFSTLSGHKSTVWSLAWSPQGSFLASSSDDLTIRIWKRIEEYTWKCVMELRGHDRSIYSISWGVGKASSPSLGWLATTGGDGKINVWDITVCLTLISHCIVSYEPFQGISGPERSSSCEIARQHIWSSRRQRCQLGLMVSSSRPYRYVFHGWR